MPRYLFRLTSPYTGEIFDHVIEASSVDEAKKKILKTVVHDPKDVRLTFKVEETFIIAGPYPLVGVIPTPYIPMPEEKVKEAKWLKGALGREVPLAIGSEPVGPPKLEAVKKDSLTWFVFSRPIRSKAIRFLTRYPKFEYAGKEWGPYEPGQIEDGLTWEKAKDLVKATYEVVKPLPDRPFYKPGDEITVSEPEDIEWAKKMASLGYLKLVLPPVAEWLYPTYEDKVSYAFDIFTPIYERARSIARAGNVEDAILYLVEWSQGIPLDYLCQILGIGYYKAWRTIAENAQLRPEEIKKIRKNFLEHATLERWMPELKEEIANKLVLPKKEPKLIVTQWHDRIIVLPTKIKTTEEVLEEIKRIMAETLKKYPVMTKEEEEKYRRNIRWWLTKQNYVRLTYWLY